MDRVVTTDVFASPAVDILAALVRDNFRVELTADGGLAIAPKSKLTPERMQTIAGCKDALKVLVSIATDAGVHERRDAFRAQLEAAPTPTVPAFRFRAGVSDQPGICFSCGTLLREARFGRCWRCSMAWRLAARLPVSPQLASALDEARVA